VKATLGAIVGVQGTRNILGASREFTGTDINPEAALAAGIFHRKEVPFSEVKEFLQGKVEIRPT
jgi:imidazole glycerol phosphate synthase subunit HisF